MIGFVSSCESIIAIGCIKNGKPGSINPKIRTSLSKSCILLNERIKRTCDCIFEATKQSSVNFLTEKEFSCPDGEVCIGVMNALGFKLVINPVSLVQVFLAGIINERENASAPRVLNIQKNKIRAI